MARALRNALPDVALSSTALFHVERAAALLAVYMFVLVVLVRAWRGELPSEMSSQGIKYATSTPEVSSDAIQVLSVAVDALQARIDRIEDA